LQRKECCTAREPVAEVAARDTPLHDSPPSVDENDGHLILDLRSICLETKGKTRRLLPNCYLFAARLVLKRRRESALPQQADIARRHWYVR
jgi:hypothetical protein